MADISAALPDADLFTGSIVTIDVGSSGAAITAVTVHGWQEDAPTQPPPSPEVLLPIAIGQEAG